MTSDSTQNKQKTHDFTQEEVELLELVDAGDVEGVLACPALERKSNNRKIDLVPQTIDNSIKVITKEMWELYNGGQRYLDAANIANKKTTKLENIRKEVLKLRYEAQGTDILKKMTKG